MMKTVRFMLFPAIVLVLLIVGQVTAQSGYSVNDKIARLKKELNLTQDQSRKVAILLIKTDEKQFATDEALGDDFEARREAAQKRRKALDRDMKLILDSEQYEKYKTINLRSPSDRTARQIKGLTEALALTEDQIAKVQAVYEKYQPELELLFKSFRSGGGDSDRQGNRTKMGEIRKKMSTEISVVLTEEQEAKYKTYLEENRSRGRRGSGQSRH